MKRVIALLLLVTFVSVFVGCSHAPPGQLKKQTAPGQMKKR
jgi:hypothetical protein